MAIRLRCAAAISQRLIGSRAGTRWRWPSRPTLRIQRRGRPCWTPSNAFGRLDILINNAGAFIERDFTAAGATQGLEEEVALNLTGPIELTHEVLSRWPSPEALVFVTSGFALVSPRHAPTYGATKAGLHAFADSMRMQLAPGGTHVLELLPPMVDTPMNAGREGKKMTPEAVAEVTLKALADRRDQALPGEVALLPLLLRIAPGLAKSIVTKR